MRIPDKNLRKKKYKFKIFKKIFIISISFSIYSFALVYLFSDRNIIKKNILNLLGQSQKQLIKDSFLYQTFKSNSKINIPINILKGFVTNVDPLYLDINQENLNKLLIKRKNAIEKGVLISEDSDFVSAKLTNNNSGAKVKLRLKGDWTDHLQSRKWSYRVKVKNGETFLGMRKFSLQSPGTRNYHWEWVFHKLLKDEGLPSIRYFFKPLILNGENLGIYALEEHFDKILIESNNYKEGPIVKMYEGLIWENFSKDILSDNYYQSYSTGFNINRTLKDPILKANLIKANQLLNGFHNKSLSTSEVFDIKKLSIYFAISDLMGAHHGNSWNNERFYFDPMQLKIIPIGFDGDPNKKTINNILINKRIHNGKKWNSIDWTENFFEDIDFTREYISSLEKVSKESFLKDFLEKNKKLLEKNINILYKSYPALNTNFEAIYKNQNTILKALRPNSPLNIFLNDINSENITLSIGNNQRFPIKIEGLKIGDEIIEFNENKYLIKGKKYNQIMEYENLELSINKNLYKEYLKGKDLKIVYSLYGSNYKNLSLINKVPRLNPLDTKKIIFNQNSDFSKFNFIDVDYQKNLIIFKKGKYKLNKTLKINDNFKVIAEPGFEVELSDEGKIISFSPINFVGAKNNPIKIYSQNLTKNNGIIIINSTGKSRLKFVIFKRLGNLETIYLNVPGAVTFYQSPVEIIDCNFEDSYAEDALNIVRSEFKLKNSKFINSMSDAIDIDFSMGSIENIFIKNSRNDGLDLSGSKINGSGISIYTSKDKALSIGEGSFLKVNGLIIDDSKVGVANKDGSEGILQNVYFTNTEIEFAGFQKKSEYSPSKTKVSNINKSINQIKYFLSKGSEIKIDNTKLIPNNSNKAIYNFLYE